MLAKPLVSPLRTVWKMSERPRRQLDRRAINRTGAELFLGQNMPIRETKKFMRAIVAIGVAIAVLAMCAMLILEFPPS